jgi:disulfide bond formation protein DsbB
MKKSLSLLFATIVMAAAVAAAAAPSNGKGQLGAGSEPCPLCPPGTCAIN